MSDLVLREGPLTGTRIAVLIESDYFEPEIHFYQRRFAEEGAEVHFLTRLWGQQEITFTGHEGRVSTFHLPHRHGDGDQRLPFPPARVAPPPLRPVPPRVSLDHA